MPTRILREGINSSQRINRLSPGAEILYRRLMSVADDYGRYYANPTTIRGACLPTHPNPPCEQSVINWISECTQPDIRLLVIYESEGCKYLEIVNFKQQTRSKSKFPNPAEQVLSKCLASDTQVLSNCFALDVVGVGVGVEDGVVVEDGVGNTVYSKQEPEDQDDLDGWKSESQVQAECNSHSIHAQQDFLPIDQEWNEPGDHITGSEWDLSNELTNQGADYDNNRCWITISGGVLGRTYLITNRIQLDSGMVDSRSFQLVIADQ